MSEPITALRGARYDGLVTVSDAGLQGMITLRAAHDLPELAAALSDKLELDLPATQAIHVSGDVSVAWMSPDELLIMCLHDRADALTRDLAAALGGVHALVSNVSDARCAIDLDGQLAREVMAKLTPADVAPGAFGPGQIRRSRLAQVPAAFWMPGDDRFRVVAFRSVAQYVWDLLCTAADPAAAVGLWPRG